MNIVKDNVIYSFLEPKPEPPNQPYIERLLAEVRQELEDTGDRDWLVDTETGQSHKISRIEPASRKVAGKLSSLGFGPGDVLQTGYSTCLDFYWPVLGAWLCGGAASLGDPNISQQAIKQQLLDTDAKIVVCSRHHVDKYYAVTQELQKAGSPINLYVLDAEKNDTLPVGVESFQIFLEYKGDKTPPAELKLSLIHI